VTASQDRSFQSKELDMLKIEQYSHDNSSDPPPSFATGAEIEIADRLRHELEERYLAPRAPLPARPDMEH
jgi:hypothetical protein